ncbi:MAG: DUF445 domain-containing protein [Aeromicrobium sp.]
MTTTIQAPAPNLPPELSEGDAARRRGLRRMRLLAVSLLVLAAIVYIFTRETAGAWGYVNAAAEAAMVGAIADWFAVTALFRHPLGLPIPHTAIIPNRKQALGESLQEFVTDNFLSEGVVRERIESAGVSRRAGGWLVAEEHSHRVVTEGSKILADGLAAVKLSDVAAVVEEALIPRLKEEPLSPVVGQLLAEVLDEDAHRGLVDLVVNELHRWLVHNEHEVAGIVELRAPWWTPRWVDERVALRVHAEAVEWVAEIRDDPQHLARNALDRWLTELASDLQHNPATMERAERLKVRLLSQPQVASTSIALWEALRRALVGSLHDTDGLLRRRAVEELHNLGNRLMEDEELAARMDTVLADVAAYVVNHYGSELATIISATVDRWDGKETAERIELHVGRDLQFIRINGTVVGGLTGLAIHTASTLL